MTLFKTSPTVNATLIQHDWTQPVSVYSPRAHLIFADPPYNQGVKYANDDTRDKLSLSDYRTFVGSAITNISSMLLPGGTFWWMTSEVHADWVGQMLDCIVGPRLYRIVWHETFSQYQGNRGLTKDYRFIFVHQKSAPLDSTDLSILQPRWNPDAIRIKSVRQEMGDKRANPKGRVPGCVWKMRRLQGTSNDRIDWHPTQLPPELLDCIILGWSNPGDTVVDAFVGSGVMAQRAIAHQRVFVGYDKSPTYLQRVAQRIGMV